MGGEATASCAAANSFQELWQLGSASFFLEPPDLFEVQTFLTAASEAEFEERKSMILTRLDACDPTVAEQLRRFWHNHKALVAHITAGLGHTIGPQEPCNSYDVAQTLEGENHDAMCRPCYEKHHGLRSAMEPEVLGPCLAFSHWLQQKLVTDVPKDAKYKQYLLFRNGNQGTIVRLGGGTQLAGGTQLIFYPMKVEFGCLPVIGTLVDAPPSSLQMISMPHAKLSFPPATLLFMTRPTPQLKLPNAAWHSAGDLARLLHRTQAPVTDWEMWSFHPVDKGFGRCSVDPSTDFQELGSWVSDQQDIGARKKAAQAAKAAEVAVKLAEVNSRKSVLASLEASHEDDIVGGKDLDVLLSSVSARLADQVLGSVPEPEQPLEEFVRDHEQKNFAKKLLRRKARTVRTHVRTLSEDEVSDSETSLASEASELSSESSSGADDWGIKGGIFAKSPDRADLVVLGPSALRKAGSGAKFKPTGAAGDALPVAGPAPPSDPGPEVLLPPPPLPPPLLPPPLLPPVWEDGPPLPAGFLPVPPLPVPRGRGRPSRARAGGSTWLGEQLGWNQVPVRFDGTLYGIIKIDVLGQQMNAHCEQCRVHMNRSCQTSDRESRSGQGRPGGHALAWVTLRKPDGSCGAKWHAAQKLVTSLPAAQPLRKEKRGIAEALPEFRDLWPQERGQRNAEDWEPEQVPYP